MDTYGYHVVAELSQCQNVGEFDSEAHLAALVRAAALEAKASIISVTTHKFQPQGISAMVILAESHLAVHVFPENGYIAFDCYTCGHETQPWSALEFFVKKVKPSFQNVTTVTRGLAFKGIPDAFKHDVEEYGFHAILHEE
jgi:S-adenosylmethionine decarboxylase